MPTVAAQLIPPRAFQKRKVRHGIRFAPASQEASTRRPGSQCDHQAFDPLMVRSVARQLARSNPELPQSGGALLCRRRGPGQATGLRRAD